MSKPHLRSLSPCWVTFTCLPRCSCLLKPRTCSASFFYLVQYNLTAAASFRLFDFLYLHVFCQSFTFIVEPLIFSVSWLSLLGFLFRAIVALLSPAAGLTKHSSMDPPGCFISNCSFIIAHLYEDNNE